MVMVISEPGKPRPGRLNDWPKVTLLTRPEPGRESQLSHSLTVPSPFLGLSFPICTVRGRDLSQSLAMPCREGPEPGVGQALLGSWLCHFAALGLGAGGGPL